MITELDEAIKHCKEAAEENRKKADEWYAGGCSFAQAEGNDCLECAKEHEQLAEWLTELQERREADRWIPVSEIMPECNGNYLAITNYGTRIVHFSRDKDRPYSIQFDTLEKVYYWRPLPKAPESEDNK